MIQVGIVGFGHWGKLWGKKISANPEFSLKGICTRSGSISNFNATCPVYSNLNEMLKAQKLDLVLVMTPVSQHLEQCLEILSRGISIFVTKPVALNGKEVLQIQEAAQKSKVFVDHTFLQSPQYVKFKTHLKTTDLKSILSERFQWGRFQENSSAALELIYHDIYLAIDLCGSDKATHIELEQSSHLSSGYADTAKLKFIIGKTDVELFACQTSARTSRHLDVRTGNEFSTWDFANQIWTRKILPTTKENQASSESIDIKSDQHDAIDKTLQEILLDLKSGSSGLSTLSDAMKVHKILDKAFARPS